MNSVSDYRQLENHYMNPTTPAPEPAPEPKNDTPEAPKGSFHASPGWLRDDLRAMQEQYKPNNVLKVQPLKKTFDIKKAPKYAKTAQPDITPSKTYISSPIKQYDPSVYVPLYGRNSTSFGTSPLTDKEVAQAAARLTVKGHNYIRLQPGGKWLSVQARENPESMGYTIWVTGVLPEEGQAMMDEILDLRREARELELENARLLNATLLTDALPE